MVESEPKRNWGNDGGGNKSVNLAELGLEWGINLVERTTKGGEIFASLASATFFTIPLIFSLIFSAAKQQCYIVHAVTPHEPLVTFIQKRKKEFSLQLEVIN